MSGETTRGTTEEEREWLEQHLLACIFTPPKEAVEKSHDIYRRLLSERAALEGQVTQLQGAIVLWRLSAEETKKDHAAQLATARADAMEEAYRLIDGKRVNFLEKNGAIHNRAIADCLAAIRAAIARERGEDV